MTNRDFRAIADILATSTGPKQRAPLTQVQVFELACDFARFLAGTNPRFDRDRFIAAAIGEPQTPGDRPRARDFR